MRFEHHYPKWAALSRVRTVGFDSCELERAHLEEGMVRAFSEVCQSSWISSSYKKRLMLLLERPSYEPFNTT